MLRNFLSFSLLVLGLLSTTSAKASLVAWWPFDGTADDESGNGHHGTFYGGAQYVAGYCPYSDPMAVSLDGTNDYVEVPDGTGLDGMPALTFQAWIYLRAYPAVSGRGVNILNKWGPDGPSDDSYQFGLIDRDNDGDADYLFLEVSDGNPNNLPDDDYTSLRFSEAPIPLNQWVNVSATFTPGSDPIHLHIACAPSDGPYFSPTGQQTQYVQDTTAPILMGTNEVEHEVEQHLDMILDHVIIYDAAVPPDCNCPDPTPVTPTSWGRLKGLYR